MSQQADIAESFLRGLQDRICHALEQADGSARFAEDAWTRAAGLDLTDITGLHFNPLSGRYWLAANVDVNYMVATRRPEGDAR